MKNKFLTRILLAAALLIAAAPVIASAQIYQRSDPYRYGYNRSNRQDVRETQIAKLEMVAVRLAVGSDVHH